MVRTPAAPGNTHGLPEYDYRHDAQSKGLRAVAKLGIRLMLWGNSDADRPGDKRPVRRQKVGVRVTIHR
jgi:hypothetical protein